MTKLVLWFIFASLTLLSCRSVKKPTFNNDIVVIDVADLNQYWVAKTSKVVFLPGRPKWIPKGMGKASFFITIDSNGTLVSRELIDSIPNDWMTQKILDKMPIQQYKPSITNPTKIPVKVKINSELKALVDIT
ncbi:hypothetical protein J5X91_04020 [Pseudoalteromonas sp. K222D]|nr:hypothetical protein [Pseudoalteromonas sp. K222D]MBO7925437.1 hypothetical protein [Pseudoalteromonas sp. K222D]